MTNIQEFVLKSTFFDEKRSKPTKIYENPQKYTNIGQTTVKNTEQTTNNIQQPKNTANI